MRLSDYDTSERHTARVAASERLTPENADEVRELTFEFERLDLQHTPGQSIGVIVPGPHALGHKEHFRLYTVADAGTSASGNPRISILIKRCHYIDPYSGEQYQGIASNYLCDRRVGDRVTLTGPYGLPFTVPADRHANLLMIGMGTGIAPFRAFVKQIYAQGRGWDGKVRLYYGARTGLEMLYLNDERTDFANYYDQATFSAFKAVSPRPHWGEPAALDQLLEQHRQEVWALLQDPKTHVYIAGLASIRATLDAAFAKMAHSRAAWDRQRAELAAAGRWTELVYE